MNFRVRKDDILLVDLDNTLVFTDEANNAAYIAAIKYYLPDIEFSYSGRITRSDLREILSCSNDSMLSDIIRLKEIVYKKYISKTRLNEKVYNCIKNHNPELCYLITNAKLERVNSI
ncbi:hypothetical protein V2H37_10085, partial [Avibacterium paragallinarum]|nr:hypothetical protein [Avibacterium paragallinarum]